MHTFDKVNQFQNPFVYDAEVGYSTLLEMTVVQDFAKPVWTLGLYPYVILDTVRKYGALNSLYHCPSPAL